MHNTSGRYGIPARRPAFFSFFPYFSASSVVVEGPLVEQVHDQAQDQDGDHRGGQREHGGQAVIVALVRFIGQLHDLARGKAVHQGVDRVGDDVRHQHGDGHLPQRLIARGAFDLRHLIQGAGDGLQSRDEQDDLDAGALDDGRDAVDRAYDVFEQGRRQRQVSKQLDVVGDGYAACHRHLLGGGGYAHVHQFHSPGDGRAHRVRAQDDRQEEDGAHHGTALELPVQHQGHEEAEEDDHGQVDEHIHDRGGQHLLEGGVGRERLDIVAKAHKVVDPAAGGRVDLDVHEAELHQLDQTAHIEHQEADQPRQDERVAAHGVALLIGKAKAFFPLLHRHCASPPTTR